MAKVLPASETQLAEYRRGRYSESKLERYGLTEFVVDLATKKTSLRTIAKKCNEALEGRPEGEKYTAITLRNVQQFLDRIKDEAKAQKWKSFREKNKDVIAAYKKSYDKLEDPLKKVYNLINSLEAEIAILQEKRDENGVLEANAVGQYVLLADQLNTALGKLAAVYKAVAPTFVLRTFNSNVKACMDTIVGLPAMAVELKREVIAIIEDTLLSDQFYQLIDQHSPE